jgi:hypothetical protein
MTVISYPIPPYQNVPINAGYYQPSQFVISGISLGVITTVTTTLNTNYVIGQTVRLIIPPPFGCRQLNGLTGQVLSIIANQVMVLIDSSHNVDAFIMASYNTEQAQILAIGDVNNGITSTTGENIYSVPVTIPGAFVNISPL